jgi:hypothetical protein
VDSPVYLPCASFGDPNTLRKEGLIYEEVIRFHGDPLVVTYDNRAAAPNAVNGSVMWAEQWSNGDVDVHLLVNRQDDDTGLAIYKLRHEF